MNKNCSAVGYIIRGAFNTDWRLVSVLNRTIAVRHITKDDKSFTQCADCGVDSTVIVVELSRFTPKGKRNKQPLVWGWCGFCDIGQS